MYDFFTPAIRVVWGCERSWVRVQIPLKGQEYLNKVTVSAGVFREVLVGLDSDGGLRVSADGDEVRDTLLWVDQALSDDEQQHLDCPQPHLLYHHQDVSSG